MSIFGGTKVLLSLSIRSRAGASIHLRSFLSSLNKKHDGETRPMRVEQPTVIEPIKQELIKRIPVEFHGVTAAQFSDQFEWLPIFRSPYLATIRRIVVFKVYLTAFSITSSLLYASQLLLGTSLATWKPLALSSLTLAGLVFVGDYARRLIVQIYVSEDLEYVRFCRLTFFGQRRDMVVSREIIIRLPEVNRSRWAPILDVKFAIPERGIDLDNDNYEFYELGFRIPMALGGVLDKDKFNRALGKILVDRRPVSR